MDWQQVTQVLDGLYRYGAPMVITALVIVGCVVLFRWGLKRWDRSLDKKEERDERQTAAMETLAETAKSQKEILVLMDRDCKERHTETHRRLDEQGSALSRILEHLFGDGKE